MHKKMWWLPDLFFEHRGYYTVAMGLLLTHVAFALDTVDKHRIANSKGYAVAYDAVHHDNYLLTIAHLLVVVLMGYGMYVPQHFRVLRIGALFSVVTFNTFGVAFFVASLQHDTSFFASIACVALSMSSGAAAREPSINPINARRRPT